MACDPDRAVAAASALPILIMGRSTHRQVRMVQTASVAKRRYLRWKPQNRKRTRGHPRKTRKQFCCNDLSSPFTLHGWIGSTTAHSSPGAVVDGRKLRIERRIVGRADVVIHDHRRRHHRGRPEKQQFFRELLRLRQAGSVIRWRKVVSQRPSDPRSTVRRRSRPPCKLPAARARIYYPFGQRSRQGR